jgi:hypothetical protein
MSDTNYKNYVMIENLCKEVYRSACARCFTLEEYLEHRERKVFANPVFKKLTVRHKMAISAVQGIHFGIIQEEKVEWLMYYVNKEGSIIFVKKWDMLPEYIKKGDLFRGNHFWKGTTNRWGKAPELNMSDKAREALMKRKENEKKNKRLWAPYRGENVK